MLLVDEHDELLTLKKQAVAVPKGYYLGIKPNLN